MKNREKLPKKVEVLLSWIEQDRLELKKNYQLTEYGQGGLDLIKKIRREY